LPGIHHLDIRIKSQPTISTCGPTCLQSIYAYYKDRVSLNQVVSEIPELEGGGTLGVQLGSHALAKGYEVTIYSHNLRVFDPTWFGLNNVDQIAKLEAQILAKKSNRKIVQVSRHFQDFLRKGGKIQFEPLSPSFLHRFLARGQPILTGLSATYLYKSAREVGAECAYDDVKGDPQGHFVIISGMASDMSRVSIADPHEHNPVAEGQHYDVDTLDLISAILIGVITYDANLILISKK
jgi:hypothetical protein